MNTVITGCSWVCGDGVTVYQIIAEEHWTMKKLDGKEMGNWVFESMEEGISGIEGGFKHLGFDIIVAGKDFGCGSKSVEHPMAALKGAGIKLIIAESVSRYSYRNAINLALPVLICPGITKMVRKGDTVSADLLSGAIINRTTGETAAVKGIGNFAMDILAAGGLLKYAAMIVNEGESHQKTKAS